ncbi:P-II family nitrogen regulator [filamentous cyanobacterium LEGE 11480]|uniref:P-II family nitrogen regulator n=1 Tax=Romeriopsis navalis LEGE 11480 TaxID=2777977 RepID=A0A928Z1V8_9CYAN|nr:P-II family nitrogen regulator [Romeriopsis navalis]MBE9029746.1 P-II family nitrogen regulator [Romeriopsis navalis LEGE 11480]
MHAVNRMEIMSDAVELGKITAVLNQGDRVTYSILRNVSSHGVRGESVEDSFISSENIYIIAFCPPEQTKGLLEKIRPILNKFGGACFITDATEIKSMRCVGSLS